MTIKPCPKCSSVSTKFRGIHTPSISNISIECEECEFSLSFKDADLTEEQIKSMLVLSWNHLTERK